MNSDDTALVLDTCVLLKPRIADLFMDLRKEGLFSAHWTRTIESEFVRNMQKVYGASENGIERRLMAMRSRCTGWEIFLSSSDFTRVPDEVDFKDRHVAAAALAMRHAIVQDAGDDLVNETRDVILVTDNVKDLAPAAMKRLGVRVLRSATFLNEVAVANLEATVRAVGRVVKDLKRPPQTLADFLFGLREHGATKLVHRVAQQLGVTPHRKSQGGEAGDGPIR